MKALRLPARLRSVGENAGLDGATWVFVAVLVAAVPIIFRAGDQQWFFLDEWGFLAARDLSIGEILRPHNEHLVAIPVVIYRILWRLVGLHHYWPYQVPVVTAHLASAVLLRTIMRNAGVDRWLATAAASAFVLFGAGHENIIWGFQVTFTGSLAFGLAHVLLVDHDGSVGRRDVAGWACGAAAMLCSGIGVVMVGAAGVTALLRRGWRASAFQVVPLGLLFFGWYQAHRPETAPSGGADAVRSLFVAIFVDTVSALAGHEVLGLLMVTVALSGWGLILRLPVADVRRTYASTLGLVTGAVGCAASVSLGRSLLSTEPASRYLHLVAALVLPFLMVGFAALALRWKRSLIPLIVLVLVGIPANVGRLDDGTFTRGSSDVVLAMAAVALEPYTPRDLRPLGILGEGVTTGWLADGVRAGRIPRRTAGDPLITGYVALLLAFEQPEPPSPERCAVRPSSGPIALEPGQILRVDGPHVDLVEVTGDERSRVVGFSAGGPGIGSAPATVVLEAVRPIVVLVHPGPAAPSHVAVCR